MMIKSVLHPKTCKPAFSWYVIGEMTLVWLYEHYSYVLLSDKDFDVFHLFFVHFTDLVIVWFTRHYDKACLELEKVLRHYPRDFMALKMLYGYRLMLGEFNKQRDDVARVLPFYDRKKDVEYGYDHL